MEDSEPKRQNLFFVPVVLAPASCYSPSELFSCCYLRCILVKASELISLQVDRLTGARTRTELMIGAELDSLDLKTLVFLFVLVYSVYLRILMFPLVKSVVKLQLRSIRRRELLQENIGTVANGATGVSCVYNQGMQVYPYTELCSTQQYSTDTECQYMTGNYGVVQSRKLDEPQNYSFTLCLTRLANEHMLQRAQQAAATACCNMVFCSVIFSHGEQSQALIHVLTIPFFLNFSVFDHKPTCTLGIVEETHLEVTLEVVCKLEVGMSKPVLIKSND
ncbi:hypothetical protein QL285_096914 [Trifolium repens]|nr:hypothetical protein QL285_096914 [Trifolium repens]